MKLLTTYRRFPVDLSTESLWKTISAYDLTNLCPNNSLEFTTMSSFRENFNTTRKGGDSNPKNTWVVARYAPTKFNPNNFSADKVKTQQRQTKQEDISAEKDTFRTDVKVQALARDQLYAEDRRLKHLNAEYRKQQAAYARDSFVARQAKRLEKTKLTSKTLKINLNQRVNSYAKYHKCIHGYAHNRVAQKAGDFEFFCDCNDCAITTGAPTKCTSCGSQMTSVYTNRLCLCTHYKCSRCFRSNYHYVYQDKEMSLFYDKHNLEKSEIFVTLDGETTVTPCFDFLVTVPTPAAKASRKSFLEEIRKAEYVANVPMSYAATLSVEKTYVLPLLDAINGTSRPPLRRRRPAKKSILFHTVREENPQLVELKDLLHPPLVATLPEGGALSSAISPIVAAGKSIKNKFSEFRAVALQRLTELRNKIMTNVIAENLRKILGQIFDALTYFVKVCYDYLVVLNPALIYRLWDSRSSPAKFALYAAEAFYNLVEYESNSRTKMYLALEMFGPKKFMLTYSDHDFGVLTSAMSHHMSKKKYSKLSPPQLHDLIVKTVQKLGVSGIAEHVQEGLKNFAPKPKASKTFSKVNTNPFEDDAKCSVDPDTEEEEPKEITPRKKNRLGAAIKRLFTTEESSDDSVLASVLSLLSTFPRSFGKGLVFLNEIFKKNMPLLMGIRVLGDLQKLGSRIVDSIMTTLFGECASTKEWIELQIATEGNPIHQLMSTYMVYLNTVSTGKEHQNECSLSDMRGRFYSELAAADTHVHSHKRMGVQWISFKKALTSTFDIPPNPTDRKFEPVCLALSGASAVGKSTIWPVLLSRDFLSPDEKEPLKAIQKLTHTWNPATEYQPGMSSRKIIHFDDFMQNIDEVNEALNLISLCTNAPYPINSANITGPEIKGMFAEPDAVVVCTNTTAVRAAAHLADPQALARRYDIEFRVEKRFDPKNPEDHIMTVVSCPMYSSLVNKTVSLETARIVFSTVYRAKRSRFTAARTMVSDLMNHHIDFTMDFGEKQFTSVREAWKEDGDFLADMNAFVAAPAQETPTLVTAPQGSMVPFEISACMMSTLLTGASVGVTVASAYAFSAFMINLGRAWHGTFMTPAGPGSILAYLKGIFKNFVSCAITSVAAGLSMFAIYKYVTYGSESGTSRTAKPSAQRVSTFEQAGIPDGLQTVFDQATGSVRIRSSGKLTNCIFVGGHYVLIPYHLFTDYRGLLISDGEIVELKKVTWLDNVKPFSFSKKNLIMLKGNVDAVLASGNSSVTPTVREDVCLYQLPASTFSAEKNIMKHFWDGTYTVTNMPVRKIDYLPYDSEGEHKGQLVYSDGKVTRDCIQTLRYEGHDQKIHILAEADYASRDSSCGSMVIRTTVQERPILGIHTATRNGKSYFHFVTRSSLEQATSEKIVLDVETSYTPSQPEAAILAILPSCSVVTPVGYIDKPLFQPSKTDLQPSLLYGLMGDATTAPAPLTHRDPRIGEQFRTHSSFWRQMFQGYSRDAEPTFSAEELDYSSKSLIEDFRFIKSKSVVPTKLLSLHESINGLIHVPDNTRMPMNTSCGFPYVQEGLKKTDLFEEVDGVLIPGARIVKDYDHAVACLQNGTVPFLPYALSLKDERLKHAKIVQPRTRIFTCGSAVGYLVCRRYFYSALMQYYHADIHDSFCVPSLDRTSFDWHFLSKKMTEVGDRGFDFDFSHYDRSLTHQILYYSVKVLLTGLNLPLKEEAAVLEMICSPVLIWGQTVMLGSFLTSGVLITFLANCMANELMHRAAWTGILRSTQPILSEIRFYKAYTRACRGGDDTMSTVDSRVIDLYNGRTVGEFLRSRGMKVTSATKSQDIPESSHYCDLSFLKNTTRYERGVFLPVSEASSLYESTYWVRLSSQNNDILKATQDNAICAMRPLFFHGEEVFNDFRDRALSKVPQLALPTYKDLSVIWNTYHCFPGSHSDFASREIQEDPFTHASKAEKLNAADGGSQKDMSIEIIETTPQSGLSIKALDKEQLGSAKIERAPVVETISTISDEVIDNQDAGTTSKTTVETVGTSIQDAPGTKAKPVKTGDLLIQSKNQRAEVYMNDVNWDLERLVQKFTFVDSVPWSTADVEGALLMQLNTPIDFLKTPAQKQPFDLTKFWKGTILVKVVVKASPFYAGSLAVGFSPINLVPSIHRLINMGALVHKLSQEEGIEFTIPFRWHQGFINASKDSLGKFCIYVVSPLRTGTSNNNTIDVAVYASMTDSEFKLPDTIPVTSYVSHKFPSVQTFPQASIPMLHTIPESSTKVSSVTCDINSIPSKMPTTMMCAGKGVVGRPAVSHFQDSASCLMQLLKRFELVSTGNYVIKPDSTVTAKFAVRDICIAAMRGFDEAYGMFRGSVNLRFFLEPVTDYSENVHGQLVLNVNDYAAAAGYEPQNPYNAGYQTFTKDDMAMVTIPWIYPTFVAFTGASGLADDSTSVLRMLLFNDSAVEVTVRIRIDIAIGDDFHLGLYLGGPAAYTLYESAKLLPFNISQEPVTIDYTFPSTRASTVPLLPTRPQSGMVQFIERAIENTLPIMETMSALGLELDAHMMTEQSHIVQQRKRPFSANTDLPVMTERLLTLNHNGMTLPDNTCFGSSTSETDIYNLLQNTKSLVDRFEWSEADALGTRLQDYWAGPDVPNPGAGNIHSKIPSMFNYYTGGTRLIFDVQATEIHRGQLLLAYKPIHPDTDSAPVGFKEATQTYFTTLDLSSGRATLAVDLPYLSPRPQTDVAHLGEARSQKNSTGILSIFVQNPLRSTSTVAPAVQVVVYKCFMSDFQLGVYGGTPWLAASVRDAVRGLTPIPPTVPSFHRKPLIRSTLPAVRHN